MAIATESLPRPARLGDQPSSDVIIYDGHCRFCTAQIERLARWDRKGRFSFMSLHDPEVYRRYPDLTHDGLMTNMMLVDRQGKRHVGMAAIRYLSRQLPRLWPLMPFLHIPFSMPLWQWCYRQFAKRRYLFGKTNACDSDACSIHFK